jgi:hypothetical protein
MHRNQILLQVAVILLLHLDSKYCTSIYKLMVVVTGDDDISEHDDISEPILQ